MRNPKKIDVELWRELDAQRADIIGIVSIAVVAVMLALAILTVLLMLD